LCVCDVKITKKYHIHLCISEFISSISSSNIEI
jgi:hypothetical protein